MYEEEISGMEGDEQNWQTTKIRHITLGNQTIAHFTVNPQGNVEQALVFGDHLGSASLLTDSFGRPKTLYDYYPFGGSRMEQQLGGGMRAAAYQYTGQEKDAETGLYNYGQRFYSANIGRFTQPDELSKSVPYDYLTDPQKLNEYSYVTNNPIVKVDPDGRKGIKAALITAGVFVITHPVESALIAGFLYYSGQALYYEGKTAQALADKDLEKASNYSKQALNAELNAGLIAAAWKDLKEKESKTTTGKTDPQTSGKENAESKPKPTDPSISQTQDLVRRIDKHGSYEKHVLGQNNPNGREYGTLFQNKQQWDEYIENVISKPSASFNGPTKDLYWDNRLGTIVINNKTGTPPTAFHPQDGYAYYQREIASQQKIINNGGN